MTDPSAASTAPFSLRALGSSAGPLVVAGIVGQLFAIVRTVFVAARVGTSPALDGLLVALVLPVVVSGLLVSSLRTAIVPAYMEIARAQDEANARRFVGAVVTWIAMLSIGATALIMLAPGPAVAISGPGLEGVSRTAVLRFMPFVAPILCLSAISTILGALCQIAGRFRPIAVGMAVAPLASLIVTVALWDSIGLDALAFGLTLGAGVTLAVTIAYLAIAGLLPPLVLRTDRRHVAGFLRHAVPLTAGSALLQFNLLADRAVASLLPAGAISALYYAGQIILQPLSSVAFAWQMVAYPALVKVAHDGSLGSLGEGAMKAIRAAIVVFLPITVAAIALGPIVVGLVLRRGAFGAESAALVVSVTAALAPLLLALMIQPILTGAHNARRHGTLLGLVAVANAILNVLLNLALGLTVGVAGVALSTSLTTILLLLYLAHRLSTTEEGFAVGPLIAYGGRVFVASMIPAVPLAFIAWILVPPMALFATGLVLVGMLLLGLAGYLGAARLLSLDEPSIFAAAAGAHLRRLILRRP